MSAPPEGSFLAELRRVEAELPVPLPDRLRFLRELEYDLEALRSELVAQGLDADEAHHRAVEALLPGGGALAHLADVHRPAYRRLTHALAPHRLRRLERGALALATVSVLLVQAGLLVRADLARDPSPFLAPVVVLGGFLFALCAWKVFKLWIKRDHRDPERGLTAIACFSIGVVGVAFAGALVDTYHLAAALEHSSASATPVVTRWIVRECVLLATAIIFALGGGLTWFVIEQWRASVDEARREILGPSPQTEEISR